MNPRVYGLLVDLVSAGGGLYVALRRLLALHAQANRTKRAATTANVINTISQTSVVSEQPIKAYGPEDAQADPDAVPS